MRYEQHEREEFLRANDVPRAQFDLSDSDIPRINHVPSRPPCKYF